MPRVGSGARQRSALNMNGWQKLASRKQAANGRQWVLTHITSVYVRVDQPLPPSGLEAVMDLRVGVIHPLLDDYLPQVVSV